MIIYNQTKSGSSKIIRSEDITETVTLGLYKPLLWLWPWQQQPTFFWFDTLLHYDTLPYQVQLQLVEQFRRYLLVIWTKLIQFRRYPLVIWTKLTQFRRYLLVIWTKLVQTKGQSGKQHHDSSISQNFVTGGRGGINIHPPFSIPSPG